MAYHAARCGIHVAALLPDDAVAALARATGCAAPWVTRRWRVALANLRLALGKEADEQEVRRIARAAFGNLARSVLETARVYGGGQPPADADFDILGMEHFSRAAAQARGIVLFTGHLGNWELAGAWFARRIHATAALARLQPNPLLNRLIMEQRQRLGLNILPKRCPWPVIRSFLDDNYAIGFLSDQHAGRTGVPVRFFGRDTSAPRGPVLAALRTGAPLLPAFAVRCPEDPRRHRICFEPAVDLSRTGRIESDLIAGTQQAMNVLESYVRRYPEQWLWMHRRWRPDDRDAVRMFRRGLGRAGGSPRWTAE